MKIAKIVFGTLLMLMGAGIVLLGIYIVWRLRSLGSFAGFTILAGIGLATAYVGFQLARGDSLKDALYFLSFFH